MTNRIAPNRVPGESDVGHQRGDVGISQIEAAVEDPRQMRERLARWFSDFLYKLNEDPRPRESVTVTGTATRSAAFPGSSVPISRYMEAFKAAVAV